MSFWRVVTVVLVAAALVAGLTRDGGSAPSAESLGVRSAPSVGRVPAGEALRPLPALPHLAEDRRRATSTGGDQSAAVVQSGASATRSPDLSPAPLPTPAPQLAPLPTPASQLAAPPSSDSGDGKDNSGSRGQTPPDVSGPVE